MYVREMLLLIRDEDSVAPKRITSHKDGLNIVSLTKRTLITSKFPEPELLGFLVLSLRIRGSPYVLSRWITKEDASSKDQACQDMIVLKDQKKTNRLDPRQVIVTILTSVRETQVGLISEHSQIRMTRISGKLKALQQRAL